MNDFRQRLHECKIVQWALAYGAAFALIQCWTSPRSVPAEALARHSGEGSCSSFQRRLESSSSFDLPMQNLERDPSPGGATCTLMSFELAQEQELGSSLRWNDENEGFAA